MPADAELSRHDPDVPDWDSLPPDARRLAARMMEVFAGLPVPHRPPHRPAARLPAGDRRARQHARHGGLRQRRQRRGRPDRHHERAAVLQQRPGAARGQPGKDRRDRRTRPPSTTTRGAGPGPATPRSGAGSGRPTAAAPATRSWCTGRTASARAARSAPSTRTSSTWSRPCWTRSALEPPADDPRRDPVADPRRQLRPHLRRRGGAAPATAPSTSRCSATAPSTTTGGGRSARGRGRRSPRPAKPFGAPITARDADRPRRPPWELYHVARGPRREPQRRRRAPRQAHRADRASGTSRPASTTSCRSTAAAWQRMMAERAADRRAADQYTSTGPDTQTVPFCARPAGAQPAAQHHRRRRDPRRRRRGRPALPGHRGRRLLASTSRTAGCTTPTTTSAAPLPGVVARPGPGRPAPAPLRVRADRASPTSPSGKGAAGPAAALRRRPARRPAPIPGHHAVRLQPRRTDLRRQPRLPGHPDYQPRSGSPAPCTPSPSTCQRRPHQRHRERDADGDGPAVALMPP